MFDSDNKLRRPDIFVSATSGDLRSVREIVKSGLLKIGCFPIEQSDFPADYRSVEGMLRERISECDAVVHIVGMRYGSEPPVETVPEGKPRRSYTQLESDIARELGIPIYVFVCPVDFPYDDNQEPESNEKQLLQQAYREQVLSDQSRMRYEVGSTNELERLIASLRLRLEQLAKENARTRKITFVTSAGTLCVLAMLTLGIWLGIKHFRRGADSAEKIADRLDQTPVVNLRKCWVADGPLVMDYTKRIQGVQISLNTASQVAERLEGEVGKAQSASQRLSASLEEARGHLENGEELIEIVDTLRDQLDLISVEMKDLGELGKKWDRYEPGIANYGQLAGFECRIGRFFVRPRRLHDEYALMCETLGEEMEAALADGGGGYLERERKRQARRDAQTMAKRLELLTKSSIVSAETIAAWSEEKAAAESAIENREWVKAKQRYQVILDRVQKEYGDAAQSLAIEMGADSYLVVRELLGGPRAGSHLDALEMRMNSKTRKLGVDFDACLFGGFVDEIRQQCGEIVRSDLRPSVELQWGSEVGCAVEASFVTHYLLQFLHPGYEDGRAIKVHARYDTREQMLEDLEYLDSLYRKAKIPAKSHVALDELKKRASEFDFANEYRSRGSESHQRLFDDLYELVKVLNGFP